MATIYQKALIFPSIEYNSTHMEKCSPLHSPPPPPHPLGPLNAVNQPHVQYNVMSQKLVLLIHNCIDKECLMIKVKVNDKSPRVRINFPHELENSNACMKEHIYDYEQWYDVIPIRGDFRGR